MKKIQHKTRTYTTAFVACLMLSIIIAVIPMAKAAGAITLNPTTQGLEASVTVDGTGFGATKAVGIGFGAEAQVNETNLPYSGTGLGPYSGKVNHLPIKPGSFTSHTTMFGGVVTDYTDNGDGTLASISPYFVEGFINYVTGNWSRTSTIDLTGLEQAYSASYTYYTYNVTPAAGVTTGGSGAFTASITVPIVADGSYTVTAVDTQGNVATSTLVVDHLIPEGLTVGVMVALSSVAVVVGTRYFKKPKIKTTLK
ncbi:MAG TPA: hypothetical protein VGB11_04460 [Candidatus Bathyarchaeia archaeon]